MPRFTIFVFVFLFQFNFEAQCDDVTLESITNPGPFNIAILKEGVDPIRNGPDYDGATIYYPLNGDPPYAGIAIVPGYCGVETDIQDWGPFYASHGIIAITLGTNDPCADWPINRAVALLDAIVTVKEENTRSGSPLENQIDINRFAVSGWSMGGGGAQLAASMDPSLKAIIGLCPWLDLNGFEPSDLIHDVPVLIFTGQNDDIANSAEYGYMHYQGTPSSTDKLYFEIENGGHDAANGPDFAGGEAGIYALSWLKNYLLEDPCYCQFLQDTPVNSSSYETNIECLSTGLYNMSNPIQLIRPNPFSDYIELNNLGSNSSFKITTVDGKLIDSGILIHGYNKIEFSEKKAQEYYLIIDNQSFKIIGSE